MTRLLAAALAACLTSGAALAQTADGRSGDEPATESPATVAPPQPAGAAEPAGPTSTAADQKAVDQALVVSQVKLTSGQRASRLIGASVYNEAGEKVGSVDDVILSPDARATLAALQVGGFLGVGGKLVAVPFDRLQTAPDGKVTLSGGSKDSLNAQPSFTY